MQVRLALLQLLPTGTPEGQLEKGKAACVKAKELGADIALFPEMWSDGYALPQDSSELDALSIDKDSGFIGEFGKLAGQLRMAIGITFLEKHEPKPLNSMILFDRSGVKKLHYSKVHTCDFDLEKVLSSGDDFYVTELDIGRGSVKIGSMICFDREFPESARILMLKGAEIILAPNACPMEINRLSALRTRAYENMLAVATCNYPKGQPDCNGHSTVFDGVAWLEEEPDVRDMCILNAPEEEGIYLAEIDMDLLRRYREKEVMGNKYRHPAKYGILTAEEGTEMDERELEIKRYWNEISDSEWYRSLRTEERLGRLREDPKTAFYPGVLALMEKYVGDFKGKKILLPSSGDNHAAFAFALMGARVTSADISERQLENAGRISDRWNLDIEYVCDNTTSLSKFSDGTFDLVYTSNGTLSWINDLGEMYGNIERVLKWGGYSAMFDIHPFTRPFTMEAWKAPEIRKAYDDVFPDLHWRVQDIVNAQAQAGLRILEMAEIPSADASFWYTFEELKSKTDAETANINDWKCNPMAAIPAWIAMIAQKPYHT